MRILYIDIDSLRPDHLGCYGYHRDTSPNLDRLAAGGVRYTNCYASDVPCLPSRTSLTCGRFGIHNGVVGHGGTAAQPFVEGRARSFSDTFDRSTWAACMRQAGYRTVLISPFGERHAAWHFYAGFQEMYNTGGRGAERADEVSPVVIDWIKRNAKSDNWFLHLNVWDPHTPYRTPDDFGNPFADQPTSAWLTNKVRQDHWSKPGPHSAREVNGFGLDAQEAELSKRFPGQPSTMDSMEKVRMMFDGYDRGVRYADHHVGLILQSLQAQGVLEDTVIIISSDHGENLGELNIYGDHQTADQITGRVPMIIHWPGVTDRAPGRVDEGFIHPNDMAATVIEMVGRDVPGNWDGRSFAPTFREAQPTNIRDYLVVSQNAWTCQRGVRFHDNGSQYMCVRSYHDGYHGYPDIMLFDIGNDPHEQEDLAPDRPDLVGKAMMLLDDWLGEMLRTSTHPSDPMWTVIHEGGPFHTRGKLPAYMERLRATGRASWAEALAAKHPRDVR